MRQFVRASGSQNWTRLLAVVTLLCAALALTFFNAGVVRGWISVEAVARRNTTVSVASGRRAGGETAVTAATEVRPAATRADEAVDLTGWTPVPEEEIRRRCAFTKGEWCGAFLRQRPIAWRPPPVGQRSCLWNCTFVGVCDAARGWCRCAVGPHREETCWCKDAGARSGAPRRCRGAQGGAASAPTCLNATARFAASCIRRGGWKQKQQKFFMCAALSRCVRAINDVISTPLSWAGALQGGRATTAAPA